MSNGAMLGLLEGLGQGMVRTGDMMAKNELAAAEDTRRMNLERVRREWATADRTDERAYQDKKFEEREIARLAEKGGDRAYAKGEKVDDRAYAEVQSENNAQRQQGFAIENQQTSFGNQKTLAQMAIDNREPTAEDKKQERLDGMLERKEITPEEYKNNVLGLSKGSSFTQKDLAGAWEGAYKQAATERVGDMKFQGLPVEDQKKQLDSRATELVQRFSSQSVGGSGSTGPVDLPPATITAYAEKFASGAPAENNKALAGLKGRVSPAQLDEIQRKAISIKETRQATSKKGMDTPASNYGNEIPADSRIEERRAQQAEIERRRKLEQGLLQEDVSNFGSGAY